MNIPTFVLAHRFGACPPSGQAATPHGRTSIIAVFCLLLASVGPAFASPAMTDHGSAGLERDPAVADVDPLLIVISPEAVATCLELATELAHSAEEAADTVETCLLLPQEKAAPLLFAAGAAVFYTWTRTQLLRYAPWAVGRLKTLAELHGLNLAVFGKELVKLLERNGFKCPSRTIPLMCVRSSSW